jgi:hypothetical protein
MSTNLFKERPSGSPDIKNIRWRLKKLYIPFPSN